MINYIIQTKLWSTFLRMFFCINSLVLRTMNVRISCVQDISSANNSSVTIKSKSCIEKKTLMHLTLLKTP